MIESGRTVGYCGIDLIDEHDPPDSLSKVCGRLHALDIYQELIKNSQPTVRSGSAPVINFYSALTFCGANYPDQQNNTMIL